MLNTEKNDSGTSVSLSTVILSMLLCMQEILQSVL